MASGAGVGVGAGSASSLLPRVHTDFSSKRYWESFFQKRNKAFEWYGEWATLRQSLILGAKPRDKVLVIGCGNSDLSSDMYDAGFTKQVAIDFSETVIKEMQEKNASRTQLKFQVMDVTAMTFPSGSFDVVLDKGLLDAMLTGTSASALATIDKLFNEVSRVLVPGGRYLIITLAQRHVLDKVLASFYSAEAAMYQVDVAPLTQAAADSKFTPFLITVTKTLPDHPLTWRVSAEYIDDKSTVVESAAEMVGKVQEAQWLHQSKVGLEKLSKGNYVHLQLFAAPGTAEAAVKTPRYDVTVVDTAFAGRVGVLIVPQGRETEYMFGEKEGQEQLARSHKFARLIFVTMNRGHTFKSMEAVQAELAPSMNALSPADYDTEIPYLAVSADVGSREAVAAGSTELSGEYVVEDVDHAADRKSFTRRLVFMSNRNAVQSEARLSTPKVKKGKGKKGKAKAKKAAANAAPQVDHSYLAFEFHRVIVAGLALVHPLFAPTATADVQVMLCGLGGGALASFLWRHFEQVRLQCVELDGEIVDIATKHFGFTANDRCAVTVGDALDSIKALDEAVRGGGELPFPRPHVMVFDVDAKDMSTGLSFPPQAFIAKETLEAAKSGLEEGGMLVINMACRSKPLREASLKVMREVFTAVHELPVAGNTNIILFCMKAESWGTSREELAAGGQVVAEKASRKWDSSLEIGSCLQGLRFNGSDGKAEAEAAAAAAKAAQKARRRRKKKGR